MRVKLNRWRRWWGFGAALLFCFLAVDTYRHLPTAAQVRSRAADEAAAAEAATPPAADPCTDAMMTQYDRSMCEMKAESAPPPPTGSASAAAIRQAAEIDIAEHLPGRQFAAIWPRVVLWLAIVAAAYGVGGVAPWIVRVVRSQTR